MTTLPEHDYKNLQSNIRALINKIDTHTDVEPFQRDKMAESLTEFVIFSASKFVAGQQEHGGRIIDRNLQHEMKMELTDMFWYMAAVEWKEKHSHLFANTKGDR